jgi:hypothetical protein
MLAERLQPHSDCNPRAEDQGPVPKLTMHLKSSAWTGGLSDAEHLRGGEGIHAR